MGTQEIDKQPGIQEETARDIITVTPGVPFRIPESFRLEQSQDTGEIVVVGSVDLVIEGLGKGELVVVRLTDDGEWQGPIRTPLGLIITKQIRTNDDTKYDPDSSPLTIDITIDDITETQAETLACNIKTKDSVFVAYKDRYSLEKNERGQLTLSFSKWADAVTNEKCLVWFPQDPEAKTLKEGLEFTITL